MNLQVVETTVLGYKILKVLGEGGMGKVYLAENEEFGQRVAIKVLDPLLARNEEIRERFKQEARIQISLQHNNIVRVLNAQSSQEISFFILDFVDGESLDKVIKRRIKLSLGESLVIMRQVLDAVGYAHSKGVIHRDLKPSNILVCADGTAKVADFGIAKVLRDTKLTKTGSTFGSSDYMSPEQILAKHDIDHRTDIYSLGATLYEMLTGRPPFVIENGGTSDSDFLLKQAHVQQTPTEPIHLNNEIPATISNSIMTALSKAPDKRFNSCDDFIRCVFDDSKNNQHVEPGIDTRLTQKEAQNPVEPGGYSRTDERLDQIPFYKTDGVKFIIRLVIIGPVVVFGIIILVSHLSN
jgi:serine/threonine-protein kinase